MSYKISSSPHLRHGDDVPTIMYWVIGTLLLPAAAGIYYFGWNAVRVIVVAVITALLTEFLFLKSRHKDIAAMWDGSAIITGLLLALTLPPELKTSYVIIGSFFAIAVGKQIFGGLGYNIFNPALVGRAFLQAAFPVAMTTWTAPLTKPAVDAATFATPLGGFKFSKIVTPFTELFSGNIGGSIGETSAVLIIIAGLILLYKRFIDWRIPFTILVTVFAGSLLFYLADPANYAHPVFHLLSGGLMLGAVFMATDMVTSPVTPRGTYIYGAGIGILVLTIRIFGGLPEGVMYSILIMNSFVPLLNRYTRPRVLGEKRGE